VQTGEFLGVACGVVDQFAVGYQLLFSFTRAGVFLVHSRESLTKVIAFFFGFQVELALSLILSLGLAFT